MLICMACAKLLWPTPTIFSVALYPKYPCIDICMNVYLCFVLLCVFYGNCAMLCGRYVFAQVFVCLVLLHALYGFVENIIVVRTMEK